MKTKTTAFDSLGRMWQVSRDAHEMIQLTPVGHDTDPDGDGLSVQDELSLLALAPEVAEQGEDDWIGRSYDKAHERFNDERMAA